MARKRTHIPLDVFLNGRLVGQLQKKTSGAIDFSYDETWLAWQHTFPVSVSMPLREDRYVGEIVTAVFDNLLPDNNDIRRRVAEHSGANGTDAHSLLTAIGRDCVGALQFLPEGTEPGPAGQIDGVPIDDRRIARIVSELNHTPLGIAKDEELRISIAGAQHKTALLFQNNEWQLPRGSTATTHILKPQIGMRGDGIDLSRSVENEHFCMRLISALGLPTANTEIADFDDQHVLVVERFDRLWTRDNRLLRVPQEDCCQALSIPPTRKYQSDGGPGMRALLNFFKASDEPNEDVAIVLKAQMIFWLLGATDGHAKNFSIFINPGGGFVLTPLYDVMSAQPNLDAHQIRRNQLKLAMFVGDNRHYVLNAIRPRHFEQTARSAGLPAELVQNTSAELAEQIPKAIDEVTVDLPADFSDKITDSITCGIEQRARLLEAAAR